jgi:hypothetical protein
MTDQLQKITADLSQIPCPFELNAHGNRIETGALQINEDWPGVFIRGDNAMWTAMQLRQVLAVLEQNQDWSLTMQLTIAELKGHISLLTSCVERASFD